MRQIHAAIEHWRSGDFECAITLASAAEAMLPDIDEPHFRQMQNIGRINEIRNWLTRGGADLMKDYHVDTVVIEEIDTVIAIHRAILKFEAVFWQDKTPQMTSFRYCARTQALVQSNRRETELCESARRP
jgi:hypothetical protein